MKTTLYLVRHAQSHPSYLLNHSEWPLSSIGEKQAAKLADLLIPLNIETIYVSPYARCLQTMEPFSTKTGIPVAIKDDLRERLISKELINNFAHVWRKSWEDFHFALPGCETSANAQDRFVSTMVEISRVDAGRVVGVSTHGNVMGLFLNFVDPTAGMSDTDNLSNPDVVRVISDGGAFSWDRDFKLSGLDGIATDHLDTPIEKKR